MENIEKELEEIKAIKEREIKELELMNENREFYVYEHIRLDNMTCFYIGKGKGERAYDLERNDHHDNISNMCGHAVLIIKDNLTEEEAFELERDTIEDYVFNLGYGIDIEGYNDYDHTLPHLTNCTWGGEGTSGMHHSEETKQRMSEKLKGEKNPMFGKNAYVNKTPEEMEVIRKNISEKVSGEKNGMFGKKGENHPMFGKNAFANKTEEEMEIIRRKISEKNKGKNNPMFGKNAFANKTEEEMEIIRRKMSESQKGRVAWNIKKVICITTGETFDSVKKASDHYDISKSNIASCCRGIIKSAGKLNGVRLQWKYSENDDNESKEYNNPITE